MKAVKIGHTVASEKSVSAQLSAGPGLGSMMPDIAATVTPVSPTTAPGKGSRIRAATTAENKAKKRQAAGVRPAGTGISKLSTPLARGTSERHRVFNVGTSSTVRFRQRVNGARAMTGKSRGIPPFGPPARAQPNPG